METPAASACPVCLAEFPPPRDGAAFALHVARCSAPPPIAAAAASPAKKAHAPPPPPMRSCPMCHHVYARGTLPHEISFHEHECARVNERPREAPPTSNKRARETVPAGAVAAAAAAAAAEESEVATAAPAVKLFPSDCFLCGGGGRALLRCEGTCARVFHLNCVEELQAAHPASSGSDGGNSARRAQQQHWTCAECFRGLHLCHLCGFLGCDAKELVRCAVADCGRFFHRACLAEGEASEYVCPRHTCAKCGAMETDMARCLSCVKCDATTHLRCRPGAATLHTTDASPHASAPASLASASPAAAGVNANLHVCPVCAADRPTVKPSPHLGNSLRRRCANGDVVLILEYNNALLPASAKGAAYNSWGVVMSVESMEPAGAGNQLLSVSVFSDDSHVIVPNRYVLRVASANSFATPTAMIRELVKWHAMTELNLRANEREQSPATRSETLKSACKAFAARLDALAIPTSEALARASEGGEQLQKFLQQPAPQRYREEAGAPQDFAPVYMFLDTRPGKSTAANRVSKNAQSSQQTGAAGTPPPNDGDVDMDEDGEESKAEDAAENPTGPSAGTPANTAARATDSAEASGGEAGSDPDKTDNEEADAHPIAEEKEPACGDENGQEQAATRTASSAVDNALGEDETSGRCTEDADQLVAVDAGIAGPEMGAGDKEWTEEAVPIPTDDEEEEALGRDSSSKAATASITVDEARIITAVTKMSAESEPSRMESTAAVMIECDAEVMGGDLLVKTAAKEEGDPDIVHTSPVEDTKEDTAAAARMDKLEALGDINTVASTSPASDIVMASPKKRASPSEMEDSTPKKCAKVTPDVVKPSRPLSAVASKFEPLPAVSTFNITQMLPTFTPQQPFEKPARVGISPGGGAPTECPRELTRKEAVLAEFPPALIKELESDVSDYLQHGSAGVQREHRLPTDADSFPWAAHAALFRPAFYRPAVVLNRARGGRRMDGVSRLLVCQDKRNLKCFVQSAEQAPLTCPSIGAGASAGAANHHAFLAVDLVSVESFAQLMAAVRSKLLVALEDWPRFTREVFQMEPRAALRWLEHQLSRKPSEQQLGMALSYCCFDGSRKVISLDAQPPRKAASEWLCFCSNACHLTLSLSLPPVTCHPLRAGISSGMPSTVAVRGA